MNRIRTLTSQFRNLSLYLLASVIASAIGLSVNPFLAANLSPVDYAVIGYFTSFNLLVLPVISFSLLSYYQRNYFRIQEDQRQKVLDTLLLSQLVLGLIGLIFVFVGFNLYLKIAKVNFPFYPYVILCFIPTFFSCFYNFLLIEKRMRREAFSYFKIVLVYCISGAFFAILLVVILKKGALGRFWSILIPVVGFGIYSFFKLISEFRFSKKIFLDAVRFGWPVSLSAILYYFLSGVDRAFLVKLNDLNTLGIYNVAVQIVAYLYIFYTAIIQTFEPDIYKSVAENDRKKLLKIVTGITVLNALPSVFFIILANPVVRILTYGRYTESTLFAQILAVKNLPMAVCFLISDVIIAYGYPKIELINRIIGAFLSVILFKILIGKYGFYGAAVCNSVVYILMAGISGIFIVYKLVYVRK